MGILHDLPGATTQADASLLEGFRVVECEGASCWKNSDGSRKDKKRSKDGIGKLMYKNGCFSAFI